MLEQNLKSIGFNDKEVAIYLEAFRLGRTTPARIAKNTGINRTTVYSVLENLRKKGVITEDLAGKFEYVIALPPENFENIIIERKRELKKQESLVSDVIDELEKMPSGIQYSLPKFRFIEELDIDNFLYKQTDTWNRSIKEVDNIFWGFHDQFTLKLTWKWVEDYYKYESTKGIMVQLITNQSQTEEEMQDMMEKGGETRRKIKYWGEGLNFTSSVWVCGNYLILASAKEHPYYLIEVYNPELTKNLREVMKGIWKKLI